MLKKIGILGLAGIIAAGIGVAGCSGSATSDAGIDSEVATAEDFKNGSSETESVAEETTGTIMYEGNKGADYYNQVEPIEVSYDDVIMREVDGKYVYTILDGKVDVPLKHRVEDYCPYGRDADETHCVNGADEFRDLHLIETQNVRFFDLKRIAEEIGWTCDPIFADTPEYSMVWRLMNGDDFVGLRVNYQYSGGFEGIYQARVSSGFGLTSMTGGTRRGTIHNSGSDGLEDVSGVDVIQKMDSNIDKAKYLTWDGGTASLSLDQIVMIIYALEYEVDHFGEDPFYDLLSGVVYTNGFGEYAYDRAP